MWCDQIAERLGFTSKNTVDEVLMWARRTGRIQVEPKVNKARVMAEKAAPLRRKGMSYIKIGAELNADPSTVCKNIKLAIERGWIKPEEAEPC